MAFSFRDLISKLIIDDTSNELQNYNYGFGISLNDRKVRDILRLRWPPGSTSQPVSTSNVDSVPMTLFNQVHAVPVPDYWDTSPMVLTTGYNNWYNYNGIAGYSEITGTRVGNLWLDANYYLWQNTARVRAVYLRQVSSSAASPIHYSVNCEIARTNYSSNPGALSANQLYTWWAGEKTFRHAQAWGPGMGAWGSYYNYNTGYWHQYWQTQTDFGSPPVERYSYGSTNVWDDVIWKFRLTTSYVGFGKTKIVI